MKFFFDCPNTKEALIAKDKYIKKYNQSRAEESDIIVPIGGDGFLLKSLHDYKELKKPFYGINYGSVGFLMNNENTESLDKVVCNSQHILIKPLEMRTIDVNGKIYESIAFNEVSLMRQTYQAAKITIKINEIKRMNELICDGVMVSTAAGSTAYNLSAHGSILPLNSKLLALTPISSFRPRRWRGALLPENTKICFYVNNAKTRSSSVTADHNEFRDVENVEITSSRNIFCKILFDSNHSIEEKILKEQFFA